MKARASLAVAIAGLLYVGAARAATDVTPPFVQNAPATSPAWEDVDRQIHKVMAALVSSRGELEGSTKALDADKASRFAELIRRLDGIHVKLKASGTADEIRAVLDELTKLQTDADKLSNEVKSLDTLTKSNDAVTNPDTFFKLSKKSAADQGKELTEKILLADQRLLEALAENEGASAEARRVVLNASLQLKQALKDLQNNIDEAKVAAALEKAKSALVAIQPTAAIVQETQKLSVATTELGTANTTFKQQAESHAAGSERTEPTVSPRNNVTLSNGDHVSYGLSLSLLRFSTSRRIDEPSRQRNYTPAVELVPAEFGFQFLYQPEGSPWRQRRVGGGQFQMIGVGGVFLARVDNQRFERGGLALAGMFSFFDDSIGVGAGFDLYRGIPVEGPDGEPGGATAYTGLLAWGLAKEGELTPENVFVVLSVNLAAVAGRVTGTAQ
jgi:hypothetical protein